MWIANGAPPIVPVTRVVSAARNATPREVDRPAGDGQVGRGGTGRRVVVERAVDRCVRDIAHLVGYFYRVHNGSVLFAGYASWNTCPPPARLLGYLFDSNGWWLCME